MQGVGTQHPHGLYLHGTVGVSLISQGFMGGLAWLPQPNERSMEIRQIACLPAPPAPKYINQHYFHFHVPLPLKGQLDETSGRIFNDSDSFLFFKLSLRCW